MSWLKIHDRILGKCTLSKYNLSTEVLNIGLLISQKSKVTKMCMHLLLYSWKVRREKSHYLQISHKASNSWDDQCEISGILLSAHAPLLSDSWISSSGGSGAGGTPLFLGTIHAVEWRHMVATPFYPGFGTSPLLKMAESTHV